MRRSLNNGARAALGKTPSCRMLGQTQIRQRKSWNIELSEEGFKVK